DGDRERPDHDRRQVPDLPPSFASSRTSVITAVLSTALIMSMSVSAATETEVSASISTPVRSAVRTEAVIATPESSTVRSTETPWMASGWQSGIRSGVRFAPVIPAIRATASASPLGTVPSRSAATAAADSSTRPEAVAVRTVTSLAETSTIRARPASSRWVSRAGAASLMGKAYAPRRMSREDEDVDRVAGRKLGFPFGDDYQRVGAAQGGDLMRLLPRQGRDLAAVEHGAQVRAPTGRRADRAGQ